MPKQGKQLQIVIAGGIGVGKTTLGKFLSQELPNSYYFLEDVDQNPYLSLFYQDMKTWGFHSRIAYLAMKTEIYRKMPPSVDYILMDRSVHELGVFSKLQHDLGNLVGKDFEVYWSLYETLVHLSPPLDIIVYANCPSHISLERIKKRGRPYEQNITLSYIEKVNEYYANWLSDLTSKIVFATTDGSLPFQDLAQHIAHQIFQSLKK